MKKQFLALALFVSLGTFANTVPTKKSKVKKVIIKEQMYRTKCDGVTFTYSASSNAEAVQIASRYCSGGVIEILG